MTRASGLVAGGVAALALALALACSGVEPSAVTALSSPGVGYSWALGADGTAATVNPYVFPAGSALYAARSEVVVVDAPGATGGTPLKFGEVVTVREAGEPVVVDGVRGVWYRVEYRTSSGWVFGAHLTSLAGTLIAPVESEEQQWRYTVSFGPDLNPLARLRSPEGRQFEVPLQITTQFRGGTLDAVTAGWGDMDGELQVSQCPLEPVAEGPGCTTAKVRLVDKQPTQVSVVDAWRYAPEPIVEASCGQVPVAEATASPPAPVLTAALPTYLRGPDAQLSCFRVGRVEAADLRGDLVRCGRQSGGKAGPTTYEVAYYVEQGVVWTYLPCASDPSIATDAHPVLAELGKKVVIRDLITLSPGVLPVAEVPGLKLERRIPANPSLKLRDLGTDPKLGALKTAADVDGGRATAGGVLVDDGAGSLLVYGWNPASLDISWTTPGAPEGRAWASSAVGCDGFLEYVTNVEVDLDFAALTPVGALADGTPVGALLDPAHPVSLRMMEQHRWVGEAVSAGGSGSVPYPVAAGFDELVATRAWVFTRDPFGRVVRLMRDDMKIPAMCEPILYVYADPPSEIRVQPAGSLQFFRTFPEGNHGWTAWGQPDGSVLVDGRRYEDLFWEGRHGYFAEPSRGWVVDGADVEGLLRAELPAWGLTPREVEAMVEAWTPRLRDQGRIRLGLFGTEEVNVLAPLHLDPEPGTLIRVLLDARPARPDERARPPVPPAVPERHGVVVVEWGGVWR